MPFDGRAVKLDNSFQAELIPACAWYVKGEVFRDVLGYAKAGLESGGGITVALDYVLGVRLGRDSRSI